ncbi:MAG: hypothetical protein WKG32_07320 [Gemmatimonadaceae bacterium]
MPKPAAAAALRSFALAAVALGSSVVVAATSGAQDRRGVTAPRWRGEAGIAYSTPLVHDGNGTDVAPALAPTLGVAIAWDAGPRTVLAAGLRASRAGLRVDDGRADESAGAAWQADLLAGVEQQVVGCARPGARGCVSVRGAAGFGRLTGPDDVLPFRSGGSSFHPVGEVGLAARVASARPWYASLAAQAMRIGGASTGDPIAEPGTVTRILLGVRYGR